jgi:hypothetical protein
MEARSRNHYFSGKAISVTYSECVSVSLVIQHARRILRIILSSVDCLAPPYFSTLSHKRHDFLRKKKYFNIKACVWIFSLIVTRIKRDIIINVHRSSCKCRYSCQILIELELPRQIFGKYSNVIFHENASGGSRVLLCGQTEGRTDVTKQIVAFRSFANAPKNASTFY